MSFIIRSMIHFELTFVKGIGSTFEYIFLALGYPLASAPFIEKTFFFIVLPLLHCQESVVYIYFIFLLFLFIYFICLFFQANLFIYYFWLCWVFVAVQGLCLVVASAGYSSLRCMGFSLQWLLLLWSMGSRHMGFSSCGT